MRARSSTTPASRRPIDGRTGIRLVDPGNIVHAADTTGIVVVTQVQPISVIFTLPEEDLPAVSRGAGRRDGAASPPVARRRHTELDQGTLTLIDNEIDQATGTAKLKATFGNDAQYALARPVRERARAGADRARNVLTVPTAAVQLGPNGPFTYVVKGDSTVEVRPLKIGEESGGMTVVNTGLALNERVVTSNQYRLQAGVRTCASIAAAADSTS